jgi:hypothetical protein
MLIKTKLFALKLVRTLSLTIYLLYTIVQSIVKYKLLTSWLKSTLEKLTLNLLKKKSFFKRILFLTLRFFCSCFFWSLLS